MAFLGQTFDSNELPQGTGGSFEPLPEGFYNATITQAELKPTNDGTGQYIKLRLDITGPSHQGRVIFSNLNIKNASAKAEEIGRQQLGDIMRAIGLAKVNDTDQLIGGHVNIKLAIRDEQQSRPSLAALLSPLNPSPPRSKSWLFSDKPLTRTNSHKVS